MQQLLASRIIVPEHVLTRELEGEMVILNLETERYLGLDDVGTRMWNALTTAGTVGEACERLLDEYEVEGERLRADVADLVERMAAEGLVQVERD